MKLFFLNLQKYITCITIGKQCFHHIHVPYDPDSEHLLSNHGLRSYNS
jgi:hypothetical protein